MVRPISFFTKPIKYCMRLNIFTLNGENTVFDAVRLMKEKDSGCVTVLLENSQLGIITERDMMFRVLADSKKPEITKLKDVVTKNPITVSENSSLENALRIMRDKKLRRLIVVNKDNKPVGTMDQKMFFSALVNVLLEECESGIECKSFIDRYIHDIVERYPDTYQ
jgi:predicted transcriptional regulator